jgi:hypothetical protein
MEWFTPGAEMCCVGEEAWVVERDVVSLDGSVLFCETWGSQLYVQAFGE